MKLRFGGILPVLLFITGCPPPAPPPKLQATWYFATHDATKALYLGILNEGPGEVGPSKVFVNTTKNNLSDQFKLIDETNTLAVGELRYLRLPTTAAYWQGCRLPVSVILKESPVMRNKERILEATMVSTMPTSIPEFWESLNCGLTRNVNKEVPK